MLKVTRSPQAPLLPPCFTLGTMTVASKLRRFYHFQIAEIPFTRQKRPRENNPDSVSPPTPALSPHLLVILHLSFADFYIFKTNS